MIVSDVSRRFGWILCSLALLTIIPFKVHAAAQVPSILTPIQEPELVYTHNNSGTDLELYATTYDTRANVPSNRVYTVWVMSCHSDDSNATFAHQYSSDPDSYIVCTSDFEYRLDIYDAVDGSLVQSFSGVHALYMTNGNMLLNVQNYYRAAYVFNQGSAGTRDKTWAWYYNPVGLITGTPRDYVLATAPFVEFSPAYVPQDIFRSFVSRPVADQHNRYFILAGHDVQYLYAVRWFVSTSTSVTESAPIEFQVDELVAPYLDVNNNGLQLRLGVAEDQVALIGGTVIEYDIQVSVYNLSDGQYVASYVFSDYDILSDSIDLNVIYPDIDDIESCDFYGVMYQNTSTRYKWHLLTCVWSADPLFEQWQQSVVDYLDQIYQLLNQQAEDVTIEQDTEAGSELQNVIDNLQPTNEQGSKVNTADVVSEQFSDAQQYISDLSDGAGEFNDVVDDFLFSNPFFYIPIIVALAAGLLITILGKNKSND